MDDPQRCGVDHTPTVTIVIAPVHRVRYSDVTSGEEDGAMYNDYELANIAWQRQQEAERAAAAHRLVVLARLGTKGAADGTGRLSRGQSGPPYCADDGRGSQRPGTAA